MSGVDIFRIIVFLLGTLGIVIFFLSKNNKDEHKQKSTTVDLGEGHGKADTHDNHGGGQDAHGDNHGHGGGHEAHHTEDSYDIRFKWEGLLLSILLVGLIGAAFLVVPQWKQLIYESNPGIRMVCIGVFIVHVFFQSIKTTTWSHTIRDVRLATTGAVVLFGCLTLHSGYDPDYDYAVEWGGLIGMLQKH